MQIAHNIGADVAFFVSKFKAANVSGIGEIVEEFDDDMNFMEGYHLDVDVLVDNEILLNWPMKILCTESCKGICKVCGKNLNDGDCGCDDFVPDPRMAAIKDIFNANKEV